MGIISIPKALREKLGDEGSEALVEVLNKQSDENKQSIIDLAEQRFEARLAKEASLLREDVQKTRSDLIKWMFIFWVGQIGCIVALLKII